MYISVIPDTSDPAYRQIYDQIGSQIISGGLAAGTVLPPIRTLAEQVGVSVITVRSAWELLERDGLIVTRAGSGCCVAELDREKLDGLKNAALSAQIQKLAKTAKKLGVPYDRVCSALKETWDEKDDVVRHSGT